MGFTWKHILYLIVMMTIGAALLDAIINGGLAALMYHDQVRSHLVPVHATKCRIHSFMVDFRLQRSLPL